MWGVFVFPCLIKQRCDRFELVSNHFCNNNGQKRKNLKGQIVYTSSADIFASLKAVWWILISFILENHLPVSQNANSDPFGSLQNYVFWLFKMTTQKNRLPPHPWDQGLIITQNFICVEVMLSLKVDEPNQSTKQVVLLSGHCVLFSAFYTLYGRQNTAQNVSYNVNVYSKIVLPFYNVRS